jgi:hypothetical protein
MIYLVALLAGIGAALIGAVIGLGQFALVFEVLREFDRDAVLNSKVALAAFSFSFAAVAFAAGVMLAWRWRSAADAAPRWWQTLTVAVLASAGAAALVLLGDVSGLMGRMFQLIEFGELLVLFIAMSVLALIAGAALAVLAFARAAPWKAKTAIIAIAIVGGFGVIMGALIADKRFTSRYPNLGSSNREALVEIRMPTSMYQGESALRVALRTPTGTAPARENYWFRESGHVLMRTRVNVSERTRERALVVAIDGRPDLTFPLHLPGNPRVMHAYGPWQPLGPDGMAIRFLTR